jgi:hypothetical protein
MEIIHNLCRDNYYFEILLAVHSDFKSDTVILFLLLGGIEQSVRAKPKLTMLQYRLQCTNVLLLMSYLRSIALHSDYPTT